MSIEDFIITVYYLIDDEVKKITNTHGMLVNKLLGNPPLQFELLNIV